MRCTPRHPRAPRCLRRRAAAALQRLRGGPIVADVRDDHTAMLVLVLEKLASARRRRNTRLGDLDETRETLAADPRVAAEVFL